MLSKVLTVALVVPVLAVPVAGAASAAVPAAERTCRGVPATIVGTAGDDRLTGTRRADVIAGLGGNDTVLGLSGDDVVCGHGGADRLVGGPGHDRLYGGADQHHERGRRTAVSGDVLEGGPGDDRLSVGFERLPRRGAILRPNKVTFRHSAGAVVVDLAARAATGEGSDVVVPGHHLAVSGSRHDDVLRGSDETEVLDGRRGDDELFGGGGGDAVLGYGGHDELHGEQGRDIVVSTAGRATVDGGDGADWLVAMSPATSTVRGGAGFDLLWRTITTGETGVLDGGDGKDQLELTTQLWSDRDPTAVLDAAAATAVVSAGDDAHTTAFAGIDYFTLWGSPWTFLGTEADDHVQVLGHRLHAQGLGGDDFLLGGGRADVLDGGEGTDEAWGGGGRNTCLDTEAGDCDAYPWDSVATRAFVAGPRTTAPERVGPQRIVARWLNLHLGRR